MTFELRDAGVLRGAQVPERLVPRKLTELFRSKPTGAVANLIRKEVCLQKPIFLVSAIFTACWLLTLALMVLRPAWHGNCVAVFHGLTGTQVVLMVILTGCVSLGDDKALGTAECHLTLPISARRQWQIKLLVAAATAIATAIVLPTLLAALTLFKARVGLLALRPHDAMGFLIPATIVFVASFWSGSMVANTVRGALTCMVTLTGIAACVMLGGRVPEAFFISSPPPSHDLQSVIIAQIIAHFQLSPDYFAAQWKTIVPYSILLVGLVLVTAMLVQSLTQFRRVQTRNAVKAKCAVVLAAIAFGGAFWCVDLAKSIQSQEARFRDAVIIALSASPPKKAMIQSGTPWEVTVQELEQTGLLSYTAKTWLRNARITVTPIAPSNQQPWARYASRFTFSIQFPDGRQFFWTE